MKGLVANTISTAPSGIAAHLVYELDPDGKQLRVVKFSEYAAEKVRTLYPSAADLRKQWADPTMRAEIINKIVRERNRFRSIEVFEQPTVGRPVRSSVSSGLQWPATHAAGTCGPG